MRGQYRVLDVVGLARDGFDVRRDLAVLEDLADVNVPRHLDLVGRGQHQSCPFTAGVNASHSPVGLCRLASS